MTSVGDMLPWYSHHVWLVDKNQLLIYRSIITCNFILTCVSGIAQGMFFGAKYTHHTVTPIIKQQMMLQQQQQTTANTEEKSIHK